MTANTINQAPSVFESFNARTLAAEQVAKTFIAPECFSDLTARCHTTVVGPRGSGKTSLLKMLQPNALEAWGAPEAAGFRAKIDYTGVFVPTDISWNKQTLAVVEGLPEKVCIVIRNAAFTAHVLHELIDMMVWRSDTRVTGIRQFRRVSLARENEKMMVQALMSSWGLMPSTFTLLGLKHSLSARMAEIWGLAQRAALLGCDPTMFPSWMTLEFLSCANHAVELFDDAVGESEARWAFLFDELELAPEWLMNGLLTSLRSTADKFLFKLAVSPFNEKYESLRNALQAMPDQDYKEIRLWHAKKEEGLRFSEKLFVSVCGEFGINISSATEVLGSSFLESDKSPSGAYRKGGRHYRIMSRALRSDPSFAKYWKASGVSLDSIAGLDEEQRAAKVRKIYPLLLIRNFFRTPVGTRQAKQQQRRGRKSMQIYSGASSVLTIAEGNPRWIIGLTRLLLTHSVNRPVRRHEQAREIEGTIHKFRARLKTISLDVSSSTFRANHLLEFLDKVGEYMQNGAIVADFCPEPALSFTVDSKASPELISAIGRAVNAGALVYLADKNSLGILNDVKGKKFRLSYLLAPYYHLPLRLGGSVSLSFIVGGRRRRDDGQTELLPI